VRVQYYITKKPGITIEDLYALVGEGATLEPNEKLFVRKYVQKLKAYDLVRVTRDHIFPSWPFFTTKAVKALVEYHKEELTARFSPRTVKAWVRGERHPDLNELLRVLEVVV